MAIIQGRITLGQSSLFELDENPLISGVSDPQIGIGDFCIVDGSPGIWQKTGAGNSDFYRIDYRSGFVSQATANGTLILDSSSSRVRVFTGTTSGQIVRLPAGNTLNNGDEFIFINDSTQNIIIQATNGTQLYILESGQRIDVILTSNQNTPGSWTRSAIGGASLTPGSIVNGELAVSAVTTTNTGTRALVTGLSTTPVAGKYRVAFTGTVTHSANGGTVNMALNVGGVEKTGSLRSTQTQTNANTRPATIAINGLVTVNGSQAIQVTWNITTAGTGTLVNGILDWIKVE